MNGCKAQQSGQQAEIAGLAGTTSILAARRCGIFATSRCFVRFCLAFSGPA
jgi:hypothetical protein